MRTAAAAAAADPAALPAACPPPSLAPLRSIFFAGWVCIATVFVYFFL